MVRGHHNVSVWAAHNAVSPGMPLVLSPVLISGTVGIGKEDVVGTGVGGDQQL